MSDYTAISKRMMERALSASLTAEEACDWLMRTTDFRTLPEKLMRFYDGAQEELKALLRDGLNSLHPDPAERDAIRHNLRNWFAPVKGIDSRTISRQYAYEICFIMGLPLDTADAFLTATTGEGIHYRGLDEFVFAYGLHQGMPFEETKALQERVFRAVGPLSAQEDMPQGYTKLCREEAVRLSSEEALLTFAHKYKHVFGAYRSTAYGFFTDMMDVLQNEGTDATVEELVTQNLYRRFVEKNGRLSEAERNIRAGWPEKTQLSRMSSRELPVTRKVLILLFLASGGGVSGTDQPPEELLSWEEEGTDADFETLFIQLNAMLTDCGFSPIDPRAPFDWLVLFCMATGDVFDFDARFQDTLSQLFGNEAQSARI